MSKILARAVPLSIEFRPHDVSYYANWLTRVKIPTQRELGHKLPINDVALRLAYRRTGAVPIDQAMYKRVKVPTPSPGPVCVNLQWANEVVQVCRSLTIANNLK